MGVLAVLSAEPVARTYSLNGLKPRQLTSAVCTTQLSTTPAPQMKGHYNAMDSLKQ